MKYLWNIILFHLIGIFSVSFVGLSTMIIAGCSLDREIVSIFWCLISACSFLIGWLYTTEYNVLCKGLYEALPKIKVTMDKND